jgi:hypothetical protein
VSAHDHRRPAGIGTGSPDDPAPGEAAVIVPTHAVAPPWEKGDVVRAVAEFVDDLVDEPGRDVPGE